MKYAKYCLKPKNRNKKICEPIRDRKKPPKKNKTPRPRLPSKKQNEEKEPSSTTACDPSKETCLPDTPSFLPEIDPKIDPCPGRCCPEKPTGKLPKERPTLKPPSLLR